MKKEIELFCRYARLFPHNDEVMHHRSNRLTPQDIEKAQLHFCNWALTFISNLCSSY